MLTFRFELLLVYKNGKLVHVYPISWMTKRIKNTTFYFGNDFGINTYN